MNKLITRPGVKALVIGAIMIAITLGSYLMKSTSGNLQYLAYAVLLGGIIISINIYGKELGYNATFGNYFAHGFKVAAIVTLIMVGYLVVFVQLYPDYKEEMISAAEATMRKEGLLTADQIKTNVEGARSGFMVYLIGGTVLFNLILGVISSLIGASLTRKNTNNFQQEINKTVA